MRGTHARAACPRLPRGQHDHEERRAARGGQRAQAAREVRRQRQRQAAAHAAGARRAAEVAAQRRGRGHAGQLAAPVRQLRRERAALVLQAAALPEGVVHVAGAQRRQVRRAAGRQRRVRRGQLCQDDALAPAVKHCGGAEAALSPPQHTFLGGLDPDAGRPLPGPRMSLLRQHTRERAHLACAGDRHEPRALGSALPRCGAARCMRSVCAQAHQRGARTPSACSRPRPR